MTGLVSAATLANAFVVFFSGLIEIPRLTGVALTVTVLCFIEVWGITESVTIAVVITVLEVGALFYALFAAGGGSYWMPHTAVGDSSCIDAESLVGAGYISYLLCLFRF